MAPQKRNPLDNLGSRMREFLDDLQRLLNPQAQPKRVPVPVPIRVPVPQRRNPYNR